MNTVQPRELVRRPPRWALCGLLALGLFSPFVARAFGFPIGDFSMFTRIERYHLELGVNTEAGFESVPVPSLARHLSRDARAVILPAASNAFGKDQTDLLAGGLGDLGRLLCELHPNALSATVRLGRGALPGQAAERSTPPPELRWTKTTVSCPRATLHHGN
jgi:hypothetical protein